MTSKKFTISITGLLGLSLILVITVFFSQAWAQDSKKSDFDKTTPSLSEVESKYVCMINDQIYNKEQIPVEVEGKTYYGCCKMCEAKLKSDPNSRESIDPVSNKKVDKALSVIGATQDGNVYYFENETNLKEFSDKNTNNIEENN